MRTFFFVPICTFSFSGKALIAPSLLDSPLVAFNLSDIYLACKPAKYMPFLFSKSPLFFFSNLFSRVLDCCTFLSFLLPVILVDLTLIGRWSNSAVGINITF